jgi:hypothetical protein
MTIHSHEVHRLAIAVGTGFEDFRDRYEQSVPSLDSERHAALVRECADWETILRTAAENAPHDFIRYWTSDVGALMHLAGDSARCSSYLMGNHTIAERMYRHDPGVMLYAPLRTAIHRTPTAPRGSASTSRAPGSPASAIPRSPTSGSSWTTSSPRSSSTSAPQFRAHSGNEQLVLNHDRSRGRCSSGATLAVPQQLQRSRTPVIRQRCPTDAAERCYKPCRC